MTDIFVSYRRDDSKWPASQLFDALVAVHGRPHVFMDIDTIPLGADFVAVLESWVEKCDISWP